MRWLSSSASCDGLALTLACAHGYKADPLGDAQLMVRIAPIPRLVVREYDSGGRWRRWLLLGVLWAGSLALVWLYNRDLVDAPPLRSSADAGAGASRKDLQAIDTQLEAVRARLAVAERAEQVAQAATQSLQENLREREQEIAALRADLGFYQRLVGGSDRRTLGVHTVTLEAVPDTRAFNFVLTLTQNLKKSALTAGTAQIALEGVRDGAVVTLPWRELSAAAGTADLRFSFKYFQRLEGMLTLPAGFVPNRILVSASTSGGERTQQAFAWSEALAAGENDNAGL